MTKKWEASLLSYFDSMNSGMEFIFKVITIVLIGIDRHFSRWVGLYSAIYWTSYQEDRFYHCLEMSEKCSYIKFEENYVSKNAPVNFFPHFPNSRAVKSKEPCLASQNLTLLSSGGGEPCVFPFVFHNNKQFHNSCLDGPESVGEFWCPTKVTKFQEFGVSSPHWGYCGEGCPTKGLHLDFPGT